MKKNYIYFLLLNLRLYTFARLVSQPTLLYHTKITDFFLFLRRLSGLVSSPQTLPFHFVGIDILTQDDYNLPAPRLNPIDIG